jgi:hypothetical protein
VSETYAAINGERLTAVNLTAGNIGPWFADCDFEADPKVSGRVTLTIGSLTLIGAVDAKTAGDFGLQRKVRVVGGAGGWGSSVPPKSYANDAGLKARNVAEDAARDVGESLASFVPVAERVGRAYVRQAGPASRALEDVIGDVAWWVDYDGLTYVGPRPATAVDAKAYTVLAYDPRDRIATLAVDDPGAVRIGSTITERLDGPHTVRSLELRVTSSELRIVAWCGGHEAGYGQLASLLRRIADKSTDRRVYGTYRYRVVRQLAERVELQAVRSAAGLPDLLPVSMWPGAPGVYAELAPGAEVLVQFVEGDRTLPIITHFAGKGDAGFVPVSLVLGGSTGPEAARNGDAVEVLLPPAVITGTMMVGTVPTPFTGVMTTLMGKALGAITAGSSKVRIAT